METEEVAGVPVPVPQDDLNKDEYRVVLQRNKTASIGMRLVQKKHTELPFIADIDPQGPAAKTDIMVGDVLLEVNGVDARASHDELKKALGFTDAAILKLKRAAPKPAEQLPEKGMSLAPTITPKQSGGFASIFGCCASRETPNRGVLLSP